MLIFIRLLPESITHTDLRRFADKAIQSTWLNLFHPPIQINSIEIRKITNTQTHSAEYHGVIDIEPAKMAAKAIRKLHRTPLKRKEVEVRKFFQRSTLRDRRRQTQSQVAPTIEERRRQDRRRPGLVTEQVSVSGRLGTPYSIAS